MIPGTAIPTTRLPTDDTVTPARASQKVSDALSDFQPGQRLVATIQSQLANGTYRAIIAQRDVTLALPFSAKAGDQLKLEVVDTRGRVAFALAEDAPASEAKTTANASTTTTLSATGKVIGMLFAKPASPGLMPGTQTTAQAGTQPGTAAGNSAQAAPAPLNRGQPLAPPPVRDGAQLAPALQTAVTRSGLFFESHLAAWASGKYPLAELMREPLARLPRPAADAAPPGRGEAGTARTPQAGQPGAAPDAPRSPTGAGNPAAGAAPGGGRAAAAGKVPAAAPSGQGITGADGLARGPAAPAFNLPADAAPVVHQQLNALASQVYAFHAQPWADQRIDWEVVDRDGNRDRGDGDPAPEWQSRLSLAMPALGSIDALIRLRGKHLEIRLQASREDTRATLTAAAAQLTDRLSALGLAAEALRVEAPGSEIPTGDEPTAA